MTAECYTLCVWDANRAEWFAEFSSINPRKVIAEQWEFNASGVPSIYLSIISHENSEQAMTTAMDSLSVPNAREE